MWTIEQVTAYLRQRKTAIFEFLDEISDVFEWTIVVSVSVVLLLYLVYSIVPPPIHPFGFPLSP